MTKKEIEQWASWVQFIVTLAFVMWLVWVANTQTSMATCGFGQGSIMLLAFLMGMSGAGCKGKGSRR